LGARLDDLGAVCIVRLGSVQYSRPGSVERSWLFEVKKGDVDVLSRMQFNEPWTREGTVAVSLCYVV